MKKMKGILSTILVLSFSAILVGVGAKGNVDEADNNSSLLASDDSNKIVRNASTPAWNNPDDPEGYPSSQYGVYYSYHSYWSYGGVDDYWSSISNSMSIAFKCRDCWRYDDFSIFAINDGVTSSSSDITVNSDGTHTLTIQNAYRCVYQWVENFVYLGNGSPIAFYDSNKDGKYISRINFVKNSKLQVVSKYAFYNNSYLEEIDLSNCTNLTRIEDGAFENCVNLKKVILPDSVVSIGKNAFRGCTKLESSNNTQILNLKNVTYIGPNAFYGCSGTEFKTINLPSTLVTLGTQSFYNCENLEAITIPESVTQVGDATFYGCLHLTQARIYNKTLSAEEFSQCTSLASVTLNNEITVIPEKCFKNSTCTNLYRTIGADEENPDGNDTIQGFPLNLAIIKEEAFYGSSKEVLDVNNYRIQLYYNGNEVSDFSFEGEYQIKLSYIGNDLCDEPVKRYSINFNFTDMDKLYLSKIVVNGVLVDISKNQFSYYIIVDKDITEVSLELESVGEGIITVNGIEYTKGMKVSIGKESIKINVTDGSRTTGYELIIRE